MSDRTAFASDTPDIGALQTLFQTCSPVSHGWDRLGDNDRVRFTRWEGQSLDGRKHQENLPEGKLVGPFENASDARIPVADMAIREHVGWLTEAFQRATTRAMGNPETESSGRAAYARKLLEWLKRKMYPELLKETTLLAQNGCTYGPSVAQVGWERTLGYRYHELKLEDLMAAAQQRAQAGKMDLLTMFPQMLRDRKRDDESVEVLQAIYESYVEESKPSNYEWDAAPLTDTRARQVIRSLRKDGKAKLPLPYLCKNQPTVRARKLWEDCFVPDWSENFQKASAVFLVDWYSEAELRAKGKADDWDEAFIEAAVKEKGMFTEFTRRVNVLNDGTRIDVANAGFSALDKVDQIEIVTCVRKLVDEDGVLGVYETIYHANILKGPGSSGTRGARASKGGYAKHGPIDFPIGTDYPLVEWRFEIASRALCATRGLPELLCNPQAILKFMEDMLADRSYMETVPPRLVDSKDGVNYIYGGAVDVPCLKAGRQKPEYMALPAHSKTAELLLTLVRSRVDRMLGRPSAEEPPELALIYRQQLARSFLFSCSQLLSYCFKLMEAQYPPEKIEQITGLVGGDIGANEDIEDETLIQLSQDVQEFSPDFVREKWKAVSELEMTDKSGTIDPAKSMLAKLRALDPTLVEEITNGPEQATAQIQKQVKGDFQDMFNGLPPALTENDPTAAQQLQFAQEILKVSPIYQNAIKSLPHFLPLLEAWTKSKQFAVEQLGVNKQSGRVGVDMNAVIEEQQANAGNVRMG